MKYINLPNEYFYGRFVVYLLSRIVNVLLEQRCILGADSAGFSVPLEKNVMTAVSPHTDMGHSWGGRREVEFASKFTACSRTQ